MIKRLLKKLFGGGAAEPAAPAKEHRGETRAATGEGRRGEARHGGRGGHEKPPADRPPSGGGRGQGWGAAGPAATGPVEGEPARRKRRRGGRGRGRGAAGVSQAEGVPPAPQESVRPAGGEPAPEAGEQKPGRRRRGGRGRKRGGGSAPVAGVGGEQPRLPAVEEVEGSEEREAVPVFEEDAEAGVVEEPRSRAARGREAGRERSGGGDRGRERVGRGRDRETAEVEPVPLPDLPPIPPWTPPEDPTRFENYDLPASLRAGIADAGFTECTPVQAKVLPESLGGKDIVAQSQTGTGKTAAFLLTIYARLLARGPVDGPKPRALVIAPTRELAVQIESDARVLGAHTGLTSAAVFGGVDYDKQRRALQAGADLVIGTPGRLIDYLRQGAWHPEGVELLVIDEADRMFDMGFIRDLRFILRRLPHYDRRQSMLFSATMGWDVMELTYEYMNIPAEVRATPGKMTAERAVEELYHVARDEKPALLLGIIEREQPERTMIFTNTKVEAEKVAKLLEHHGLRARGITGNLEQAKRLKLMEEFKAGELPIMVATDVASRGLHIEAVSHVVNWDLPQDPEDYVHRIGRTARAGAAGKAISLADESGALNLEAIEKLIGYKIPVTWHEAEHLGEVKPGWREAAARERREREREMEARGLRPSRVKHGEAPRGGGRSGGRGGSGGRGRRR